jgi:malate synthase
MEDAATAEISRAQVWQWIRHGATLEDGRPVTPALVSELLERRVEKLNSLQGPQLSNAVDLYREMMFGGEFQEFLTLRAYDYLD